MMHEELLLAPHVIELEITGVITETESSVSLLLERVGASEAALTYKPGQFLTFRIPTADHGPLARCYSLSSTPVVDPVMKVTIKRAGAASGWLCDNAKVGLRLAALPPAGSFTPRSLDNDLLLIAGGSGITPIMSILKSALAAGSGRVALINVNLDAPSTIFRQELLQLAQTHPGRLRILPWHSNEQGLITQADLARLIEPFAAFDAFVCGPGGMMNVARLALSAAGFGADRITMEVFQSLARDPFAPVSGIAAVAAAEDGIALEVDVYGDAYSLTWPASMTLLDLLLSQGVDAPYMCRDGICGTCVCRVAQGRVRTLTGAPLAGYQGGYTLACQSLADGEDVKIVFGG